MIDNKINLPIELVNKILFTHKGLEHKTAKILKEFMTHETLFYQQEIYVENFYNHLRNINELKDGECLKEIFVYCINNIYYFR